MRYKAESGSYLRPHIGSACCAPGVLVFCVIVGLTRPSLPAAGEQKRNHDEARTDRFKQWLNGDVVYIITSEERAVFEKLSTDDERERFIEQFWKRREGGWNPSLTPEEFYRGYVGRVFGIRALDTMLRAYRSLDENEMFMGLESEFNDSHFFLGLGNFLNYADTRDIRMMGQFHTQSNPFEGPDFPRWNVKEQDRSPWVEECRYRRDRFAEGIERLKKALSYRHQAREKVLPGSRDELEYLIFKTDTYIPHLETVRVLLGGYMAYDAAFRARKKGDEKEMLLELDRCESLFVRARALARETAGQVAGKADDPTEKYILFRYNVRFVIPIAEFCKFIKNVVAFHHGEPTGPRWTGR